eukprot:TRINITY_DN9774_c0_g1_i1.p1 TRINITY_DN9774_c0_g1~~TRINITY_DN9774_c0_g1_i1.p1  ORF type:complete len:1208 (-),score=335.92 TRINITY_DN9774_c0_g1_i1:136-3759(-)
MLQSTLKARGLVTVKTLDAIIRKDNESISSRCTDMDKEMVRQLGVSKFVLSSVIFCHQEESNWPLAEGKDLKTRFDDIFEIRRFTKALDTMKKLRAEYITQTKLFDNDLSHLTKEKQRVDDLKCDLSMLESTISIKDTEFSELEQFIETKEVELDRHNEMLRRVREKEVLYKTRVSHRKHIQENVSNFEGQFQLIDPSGDVEVLKTEKEEHAERVQSEQRSQKLREREVKELERERRNGEESLKRLQQKLERLDEDRKCVENQKIILRETLDELSSLMTSTSSPLLSSPGALTRDTLSRGKSHLQLFESELKSLTCELEDEEGSMVSRKEDLLREQAKQEQTCKIREEEMRETRQLLLQLREEQGSSWELEETQYSIDLANDELTSLKASCDLEKMEVDIKQISDKKQELERRLPSLERESSEMEEEEFIRRNVSSYENELQAKKRSMEDILSEINPNLESLFVWTPPLSELENKLAKLKSEKESEREKVGSKLETLNKDLSEATARKRICEQQVSEFRSNIDRFHTRRKQLCGEQEYTQVLEGVKQEIRMEQDRMVTVSSTKLLYKEYQSFIQQKHACPVCKRGFDKPGDIKPVLDSLEKRIKPATPTVLSQQQTQLSDLGEKLENLQKLSGTSQDMVKLEKDTIPGLHAEYDQLIIQENEIIQEIHQLEKQAKSLQGILDKINTLIPEVRVLNEKDNECNQVESKINVEYRKLKNPIASKSLDEVKKHLRRTQNEIKTFETKIAEQQRSLYKHQNDVRDKEQHIHELKSAQLEQQKRKQKQAALLNEKIELEKKLEHLNKSIKDVKQSLTPIKTRILKCENELKEKRTENEKSVTIKRRKIDQFKSLINKINEKQREIDAASDEITQLDYEECVREIAQVKTKTEGLNAKLKELTARITKVENEIANSQNKTREYSDAIQLHGYRENLRALNEEIAELTNELNKNSIQKISSNISQLESILKNKRSKRDKLSGELEEKKKQIVEKTRTLESEQYCNVLRDYDTRKFELMMVHCVIDDLEYAYHKLDRCMMQFHRNKIDEINTILQELWQNTYKGLDIDYIQITADDEGTSSATGRCSYNYRVVMIKGGIEMGMRGRCSAGQKVLSCILIRLALAETFCGKCGIIALDEPTTNLDKKNMLSLAESLVELLECKARARSNFQMILITHDQQFVDAFNHSEFVEHYWRLTKSDNFSQIKKLPFSDIAY